MQWRGRRESSNVDDRRGVTGKGLAVGGGVIGVVFVLVQFFLGDGDISSLQQLLPQQEQQEMTAAEKEVSDERASFVKVVFADTEDVWDQLFDDMGKIYEKPTLVLFRNATTSACGTATSSSGPFYCPADGQVYIDLSFAQELKERFGATGDFALAYVVAHEVGHHVQALMGITDKMAQLRQQVGETEYNKFSVRLELQADFYAGLWAYYNKEMKIDANDIQEALEAANAIGDDTLQRQYQGSVTPDAFTHGTSEQRMYWFKKGYETGDFFQGNTFLANSF